MKTITIIIQGNFRCLKLLLSKGANSKEKDNEGQSSMHLSTRHKSPKCLALLMSRLEVGEVDDQDKNKVSQCGGKVIYMMYMYILSRARGAGSPSKPAGPLRATTRHGAETLYPFYTHGVTKI